VDFAQKWSLYNGSERSEAQTFLNELFESYGSNRRAVGARFEEAQEGRFLDLKHRRWRVACSGGRQTATPPSLEHDGCVEADDTGRGRRAPS
jgi:hypothetical protein